MNSMMRASLSVRCADGILGAAEQFEAFNSVSSGSNSVTQSLNVLSSCVDFFCREHLGNGLATKGTKGSSPGGLAYVPLEPYVAISSPLTWLQPEP
jgi:hypothetical protein